MSSLVRAYDARAWDLFRSTLSDDFVLVDHRPVSLGTIGPDDWVESVKVIAELGPNLRLSISSVLATAPGCIAYRVLGAGPTEDSAYVEIAFFQVGNVRAGQLTRLEFFPLEDLSAALARFEDLSRTTPTEI